jgi:hypothetical protein
MKIKAQIEWKDYLEAQLLHMQPTGFARWIGYALLVLSGLVFLISLLLLIMRQLALEFFLLIVFIASAAAVYRYALLPWRVKKIFQQQKELSMPYEIEITDAGLNITNELGNSLRPWKNFSKWKESKELFLLYHSDVMFTILPKRCFTEPAQIEAVKGNLKSSNVPAATNRRLMISCLIYLVLMILFGWILYMGFRSGAMY